MREILFRGFSPNEHGTKTTAVNGEKVRGNWEEGDLIHGDLNTGKQGGENPTCFISMGFGNGFREVIPETVGQYTGLKDKNGKRIFEGDIIKYKCGELAEVTFSNYGAFVGRTESLSDESISGEALIEVIGNKWEVEE